MNPNHFFTMPLEELAARVLDAGRIFAITVPTNQIAKDSHQYGQISRILKDLADDRTLRQSSEDDIKLLMSIFAVELENETLGFERDFEGHNDPDVGAVGTVYTHRIVTERGDLIETAMQQLALYRRMRATLLARLDAEALVDHAMRH